MSTAMNPTAGARVKLRITPSSDGRPPRILCAAEGPLASRTAARRVRRQRYPALSEVSFAHTAVR